jgi:hypothetical protein
LLAKLTKHVLKKIAHPVLIVFPCVLTIDFAISVLLDDQNELLDKVKTFPHPRIQDVFYGFVDELRLSFGSTFN